MIVPSASSQIIHWVSHSNMHLIVCVSVLFTATKPNRGGVALSSQQTVTVTTVCQAERSNVCLPLDSSKPNAASLVEFPPKTHRREGRVERRSKTAGRRNNRRAGERVRRRDARLLMRFLLTGCGECWIAEVSFQHRKAPLLLFMP